MALDSALFTLNFVRRSDAPWVVDLIDARTGQKTYTRHRARNSPVYHTMLTDGHNTDAVLATIEAQSTAAKEKTVRLHNPDSEVQLAKQSMTFHFDWAFEWEGEKYLWRRDGSIGGGKPSYTCGVIRKPDPAISTALYKPSSKGRPALMQILDYNLNRFEISDKRGLEITLVMSLCSLLDFDYDEKYKDNEYISSTVQLPAAEGEGRNASGTTAAKPSPPNEVVIQSFGETGAYVEHCVSLLRDDEPASTETKPLPASLNTRSASGLHLILLRSHSADTSAKAIAVAAGIKAAWHRLPPSAKGGTDGELHQYVRADEPSRSESEPSNGQKQRIVLDKPKAPSLGSPKSSYAPPSSLTVYLSKEALPELEPPRSSPKPASPRPGATTTARPSPQPPRIPPEHAISPGGQRPGRTDSPESTSAGKRLLGRLGLAKSGEDDEKTSR